MFSDTILRSRLDLALDQQQTRKPFRLLPPHAQHSSAARALPFSEEGGAARHGAPATLATLRAASSAHAEAGSQTHSDSQCSTGMELGDDELTPFQPPQRDVNMVSPRHDAPPIDANEVITLDIDDDEEGCFDDDEEDGEDTSSWRRPSSVNSERDAEEDAAQAATSSSRPDAGEKGKEKAPKDPPKDSVNTIFRRAVGRLGLKFSDDAVTEPAVEQTDQFVGQPQLSGPKKKTAFKKLPVSSGLRSALHTCWKEGSNAPSDLPFTTSMEGTAELGLRDLPPMTPILADCFAGTIASGNPYVTSVNPPTLSDKNVKKQQADAKRLYGRVAHQVKYLNAAAILLGSVHKLLHPEGGIKEPTPRDTELLGILPLLVSLHAKSVECVGDVLATLVRAERDRWTDPLTLRQGDIIKKLHNLTVTPTELKKRTQQRNDYFKNDGPISLSCVEKRHVITCNKTLTQCKLLPCQEKISNAIEIKLGAIILLNNRK